MTLPVAFRPLAEVEYVEAIEWYESRQAGLGMAFESAIQVVLDEIANQPHRYPLVKRDIREAPSTRFPYSIYYPCAGRANRRGGRVSSLP